MMMMMMMIQPTIAIIARRVARTTDTDDVDRGWQRMRQHWVVAITLQANLKVNHHVVSVAVKHEKPHWVRSKTPNAERTELHVIYFAVALRSKP